MLNVLNGSVVILTAALSSVDLQVLEDKHISGKYHARDHMLLQGNLDGGLHGLSLHVCTAQKREVSLEILNYKKNGDKFWNLLSMMPVCNAAGAVVSFIGVQSDITELIRRKHAERELQQAKVRNDNPLKPVISWGFWQGSSRHH